MTNSLCIRGRAAIGEGLPPYLIAEIGTNHNRDLETARRLVRTVAEQGFDCAKFQIYEVDEIVAGSVRTGDYGLDGLYGDITAQAMFARHLQTPKAWFPELKDLCHDLGIDCAVTIHGHQGRNWAASIGFDLIKIASMDHTNTPFLKGLVNQIEPPILISSGMAQLEDIERALAALEGHRSGIGLFHCVAVYPPEPTELRLANIPFLSHRFALPIGFSDHTTDTVSAVAALALGARYFEKHITLDHTQDGPDHPFALEPGQMRTYADNLRDIDLATRGDGFSAPSQRELVNRAAYVKSLIARRDLPVGHVLSDADVYLARPGHGIPPFEMDLAMGRTLARPIAAETPLCWADLEKGD